MVRKAIGLKQHSSRNMSHRTTLDRLRKIGKAEGISYLLLLGIAMPLKYGAGMPLAVSIVGSIHGLLFVVFCMALLHALLTTPLTFKWSVIAFIASLLPFGPFVIDRHLKAFETARN